MKRRPDRRAALRALGGLGTLLLAGCDRLSDTTWFPQVLKLGERASSSIQHLVKNGSVVFLYPGSHEAVAEIFASMFMLTLKSMRSIDPD